MKLKKFLNNKNFAVQTVKFFFMNSASYLKITGIVFLIILPCILSAQRYTISGFVEDGSTGERLISATIFDEVSKQGVISNVYGFYSLTMQQGAVKLIYSYVGFLPKVHEFILTKDTLLKIVLEPSLLLSEVVITEKKEKQFEQSQMSVIEMPMSSIKSLPVLFGERDVLKAIQLFPGVQSGSEGTSGLYVRGGGPDQNLILLDGVPVYNADHLFGFFSVFNPDAIQHVSLIKGGFPARYGGRLSSVIDIRMKEGNNKEYKGEATVGLIASKFTVEGPIKKDTSSFILSGRRTYVDILTLPIIKAVDNNARAGYYFYDLNAKVNYILSDKNRFFASVYTGKDEMYFGYKDSYFDNGAKHEFQEKGGLNWGNITTAVRWNYLVSNKMFSNVTATYSKFQFKVHDRYIFKKTENGITQKDEFYFAYISGIQDLALKADVEYHPHPNHKILFGLAETYHTFTPGSTVFKTSDGELERELETLLTNKKVYAHEIALYAEDNITIGSSLHLNPGLHFSGFFVQGKTYTSLQPRIATRYILRESWSVKAAFSTMRQHILLLSNSGIGLPTDLWLPSTKNVKPQESQQIAAGVFHELTDGIEVSIEAYYKTMQNLIEYKEGVDFFGLYDDWEDKIETGKGHAYGAEFLVRKSKGKTSGWIGYTLSWAVREFENVNFGKPFPYKYDRRHDIGIAVTHLIRKDIDVGVVFVYGTGNAVSLPIEKYPAAGFQQNSMYYYNPSINYYDGRNGFRTPAYHRLDVGVNMHKEKKRGVQTWSVGVYNLYNRKNPFMLYFSSDYSGRTRLKQISLFPIIPSVSYTFKF